MATSSPTIQRAPAAERRRALASSFIGSAVEYYDFLLYAAVAGLVFPKLFFAGLEPGVAQMLSYLTLFTGYVSRPLGGMLFGHFDDRFGRKNVLFITLMTMGLVSIGVGLMPTAAQIGVAAPILLTLLRLVQGFAVGGEWAGAMLMSLEHSHDDNKGFGSALSVAGGPAGAVLSSLVLALFATLPDADFLAWGWRVPFFLSVIVVLVGLYLRAKVSESPEFEAAREAGHVEVAELPLKTLFTRYPTQLLWGTLATAAPLFLQGLLGTFMVPYVVSRGVLTRDAALGWVTFASFLHIFTIPFFAWVSDRLGRKPVMIAGALFAAVTGWGMFALFNSANPLFVGLAFVVGYPLIQAFMYGPIGAYLSELFDTTSRYSGVSATYQLGSLLGAGLAPIVAQALVKPGVGTDHLAWYLVGIYVLGAVAVWLTRPHRPHAQTHAERFEESHRFEG